MVFSNCSHYETYVEENGFESYDTIIESLFDQSRKSKKENVACFVCNYNNNHDLYACLHCVFIACYPEHVEGHIEQNDHYLGVQLELGLIRCFKCKKFIYDDPLLDKIQMNLTPMYSLRTLKRKYQELFQIIKTSEEHPERVIVHSYHTIGLRGLLNLGNTCFMNCIIQTLMHTPVLRDYFFADKHSVCKFEGESSQCLVCEVFTLYQEFYSGKTETLLLHRLLALIWKNAEHLAGYEQQDAHEFFMTMLNILHKHCIVSSGTSSSQAQNNTKCNCIVHYVFAGLLQSDVVCQSCRSFSTKLEQFTEISLNISASCIDANLPPVGTTDQVPILSLVDCLEQFTRAEHLGSTGKIECSKCKMQQESTKQLTINKLPIIICFHLKRFEHLNKFHKKISTPVQFPEELDLGPFTTEYRNAELASNSRNSIYRSSTKTKYNLFSVVNHTGSIDAGHYTSFIRLHDNTWYNCNDDVISKANLLDVLCSEGYLLFYHKQELDYSSNADDIIAT